MMLLELFLSFLKIGAFSFGGGYAAMPLIQNEVVELHQWLTMDEFLDLITLSQMTPGPVAINSATFVGIKIAGIWGALAATIGCILPSCVLVTFLASIYLKQKKGNLLQGILASLRPAVIAMIASSGISIFINALYSSNDLQFQNLDIVSLTLFLISVVLLTKFRKNPIHIMFLSGFVYALVHLIF